MTRVEQRDVGRWSPPDRPAWLLALAAVVAAVVVLVLVRGDRAEAPSESSTEGSGVSVTDHRDINSFTSVELAGENTVMITVGAPLSVSVTGDDNLVERVTTVVRDGRLVIDDTGNFTTNADMSVAVSVPSLEAVELGGAGTMVVDGVMSDDFDAELTGDGTLTVSGTVERLGATLAGTGTLDLHNLITSHAIAQLQGTGTVLVHASSTLDATLSGTGTMLYSGDPEVTMHNTGTGTVTTA
jgi:hypothetical protein